MRLPDIEASDAALGESVLPPSYHGRVHEPEPDEDERDLDEPYEPVCDTCSGNRYVHVWDGRSNQRQPCPDCILRGLA